MKGYVMHKHGQEESKILYQYKSEILKSAKC